MSQTNVHGSAMEEVFFSQSIPIFQLEEPKYITHIRTCLPQEGWYFVRSTRRPAIRPQVLTVGYNAPTLRAQITSLRLQLAKQQEHNSILIATVNNLRSELRSQRAMLLAAERQNRALTNDLAAAATAPSSAVAPAAAERGGIQRRLGVDGHGHLQVAPIDLGWMRREGQASGRGHLRVPVLNIFAGLRDAQAAGPGQLQVRRIGNFPGVPVGAIRERNRALEAMRVVMRERRWGDGGRQAMGMLGRSGSESGGDLARRLVFMEREFGKEVRRNKELEARIEEETGRREEAEARLRRERRDAKEERAKLRN